MSCGFFPALDKAGWREAPGWFEAVIPQHGSNSYISGIINPALAKTIQHQG